jgi:protein-tyrosine-phosphatase
MAELRRVLILCTGNSARSQLAEAILRHLGNGAIVVESAGTRPQPQIHPMAIRSAMKLQLDMTGQRPKSVNDFVGQQFDCVITVCDNAAETCPAFPGTPARVHWSLNDPAAATGTEDERQRAFDETATELLSRFRLWLGDRSSETLQPG